MMKLQVSVINALVLTKSLLKTNQIDHKSVEQ